jgi:hypothetical protein
VADFLRKRWPESIGIGGRFTSESAAGLHRNRWPICVGISGRFGSEYPRAKEIPRIGEILCQLLWLRGYGFIKISKIGSKLERQLLDAVVWQPERLAYEADAICDDGLHQNRPAPRLVRGRILIAADVKDLDQDQIDSYEQKVWYAKQLVQKQAERKREDYVESEAKKLTNNGRTKTLDEARQTVRARITPDLEGYFQLPPADELIFDDSKLGVCTVADVLGDPQRYHGKTLRDPHEPEQGRSKARLYVNSNGSILIHSFVHGERNFILCRDLQTSVPATEINIIDAPCGTGKTNRLIEVLRQLSITHPEMKFLIVLPYLSEVQRFIDGLPGHWVTPSKEGGTKLSDLLQAMVEGKNIVTTHALYRSIRQFEHLLPKYHVVIDEVPTVAEEVKTPFGKAAATHEQIG